MLAGWRVFPVIARNSQFAGRDDAAAVRLIERRQCFRRHRSLRAVGLGQRRQSTFGDAYAGFNELFTGGRIVEAGCWAHVRRKFFDVHAATGSSIAKAALDRIGQLYAVEKIINGLPPERRRQLRQLQSKPIAEALAAGHAPVACYPRPATGTPSVAAKASKQALIGALPTPSFLADVK